MNRKERQQSQFRTRNGILKLKLADWILTQPKSTRKGIGRGHFQLPDYVIP